MCCLFGPNFALGVLGCAYAIVTISSSDSPASWNISSSLSLPLKLVGKLSDIVSKKSLLEQLGVYFYAIVLNCCSTCHSLVVSSPMISLVFPWILNMARVGSKGSLHLARLIVTSNCSRSGTTYIVFRLRLISEILISK